MSTDFLRKEFRAQASVVWHLLADAERCGLSLNEETITEVILLNIAKKCNRHGLTVRAFNKKEESIVGADWEFIFVENGDVLRLRIQAKRIYQNGRYEALNLAKKSQVTKLVRKAAESNSTPLYVFFNCEISIRNSVHGSRVLPTCNCGPFLGPSYWGCSLADPTSIRSVKSNDFGVLVPSMRPWHCLFSPGRMQFAKRKAGQAPAASILHNISRSLVLRNQKKVLVQTIAELPESVRRLITSDSIEELASEVMVENELAGIIIFDLNDSR